MMSRQLVFHFPRASPRAEAHGSYNLQVSGFHFNLRFLLWDSARRYAWAPLKAEAGQATTAVKL
jgi:hypothetical protein